MSGGRRREFAEPLHYWALVDFRRIRVLLSHGIEKLSSNGLDVRGSAPRLDQSPQRCVVDGLVPGT